MQLLKTFIGILVATCVSPALAQTNVGQLLDSGAAKLSAEDFKRQIVGRFLVGPIRSGSEIGSQEIVYLDGGVIRGSGTQYPVGVAPGSTFAIEGTWTIDERDRVCQSTQVGSVVLAPRCQFWFNQSNRYFVADSDTDRSAKVLIRTVKKNQ